MNLKSLPKIERPREKLGAKVIVKHNMKHFSVEDGITELPVALEELLKISNS